MTFLNRLRATRESFYIWLAHRLPQRLKYRVVIDQLNVTIPDGTALMDVSVDYILNVIDDGERYVGKD